MITIAIQPDTRYRNSKIGSFSDRWIARAAQQQVEVRTVDVWKPDILDQLAGSDGFMWRYMNRMKERRLGRMLMWSAEIGLGIPTFPSPRTGQYYEDKLMQKYALEAAAIPTPRTWTFFERDLAERFCESAGYPLVFKLATGFQSKNVVLVGSPAEARIWIRRMFGGGLTRVPPGRRELLRMALELSPAAPLLRGESSAAYHGHQHGYVIFQEYLPDNTYDTRVTVVGNRAWGFRRFNRPGDFRSSGSGLIDHDPDAIAIEAVRLGFLVAERLGTQSLTMDGLRREDEYVVGEISYSYHSRLVAECPGQWVLSGRAADGEIRWENGPMYSEDVIFDEFVESIRRFRSTC